MISLEFIFFCLRKEKRWYNIFNNVTDRLSTVLVFCLSLLLNNINHVVPISRKYRLTIKSTRHQHQLMSHCKLQQLCDKLSVNDVIFGLGLSIACETKWFGVKCGNTNSAIIVAPVLPSLTGGELPTHSTPLIVMI